MSQIMRFPFDRPVLLDTNALLNAVHNPAGLTAFAVRCLRQASVPLLLSRHSETEAQFVDRKFRGEDPNAAWRLAWAGVPEFIATNGVTLLSPAESNEVLPGVNRADMPIARAAASTNCYLVSDDAALISQCRANGIEGYQPWTVARSYEGEGKLDGIDTIARYRPWNSNGGYMFIRATADSLSRPGHETDRILGGMGPLIFGYREKSKAWFVDFRGQSLILIRAKLTINRPYIISVTLLNQGNTSKIRLSSGETNGKIDSKTVNANMPHSLALESVFLGSNGGQGHWSGWIQDFVCAPGAVGKKFSVYSKSIDLSPNPYDDDSLRDQLRMNKFAFHYAVNDRATII